MEIHVQHIVSTIIDKFEAEGLTNKFFKLKPHAFSDAGNLLTLDPNNCLLLEFSTPHDEFPGVYKSLVYKLLVIFSLYSETNFPATLQNAIGRLRYKDNIDRILLWSTVKIDPNIIQLLKELKTDVIFTDIPSEVEVKKTRSISHFIPIKEGDLTYSLKVNLIAEHLIKRLRKMFHLVLSEVGAPIYDKHYGRSKFATWQAMEFESDKLIRLIKRLKSEERNAIAIDVGCGTGRHSFVLSRHFDTVYAYDFSPNMIEEANKIRRERDITNIFFLVNDFEYEELIDESQFYGQCDLVVASFGMGSFIEDTNSMLRRFFDWLKPGGYIFLSFYNANAITLNVAPTWQDMSLAAQIDRDSNSLEVQLTPKTRFNIFCKLFDEGIEGEINRIFTIDTVLTYPMMMALLPSTLLEHEPARSDFISADKILAESKTSKNGYYAFVTARKVDKDTTAYFSVERILKQFNAEYEVIEHKPVLSMEDVKKEIGYMPGCMIKTVLVSNKKTEDFIAILIQAEKRVNMNRIADLLHVNRYQINMAREKEVLRIGFPLGGIAPFGFESSVTILKIVDAAIVRQSCEWFYTGMGDNRKTLKIKAQDFLRIIAEYQQVEL
jgi:ubiquinone/menaquinone biosynthesis C-methylase UbiE